ncbi:uncharacterized protein LOC125556701 [Nematostella vectensis]|uniref:uncharacterized protein LOC125556701 n=1 Tax=Nematostella vectensis TaxID=45351 RepID=UPI0020772C14|nr:uncharacterized protein LOC125556701 [Nematostella vectensis]
MGSRTVLPDAKFSGREDIREFLRDFEIYVSLNEWQVEKAGQYLAVYLKDEAKAFYHEQEDSVRRSYRALCKALNYRFEGLAILKYKKEFAERIRDEGEPLHSYLSALRLAYSRAHVPPVVETLSEDPTDAQRDRHSRQEAAFDYYNTRAKEDILCQFINGLNSKLREILVRQDDLLKTPIETVIKRIANLEEEQRASNPQQVRGAIQEGVNLSKRRSRQLSEREETMLSKGEVQGPRIYAESAKEKVIGLETDHP